MMIYKNVSAIIKVALMHVKMIGGNLAGCGSAESIAHGAWGEAMYPYALCTMPFAEPRRRSDGFRKGEIYC
jgi:hypothetical protein